jgi:glycerol-3-phosphate acyltransferase PlsY
VATGAGAFLPIAPAATVAGLLAFALTLATTRYVSLASIVGALCLAGATLVMGLPPATRFTALGLALFIVFKHRANLKRLRAGEESRLGSPR